MPRQSVGEPAVDPQERIGDQGDTEVDPRQLRRAATVDERRLADALGRVLERDEQEEAGDQEECEPRLAVPKIDAADPESPTPD
jgi:hypothetical protein